MNIKELEAQKSEAIQDLYATGRYKNLYMGRTAKSKENPLKAYIKQWLVCRGVKHNIEEMIDDYYQELFVHLLKIKAEKWEELINNPRKMTATACLIIQRQLFMNRSDKYPSTNISYFEKMNHNSIIDNNSSRRVNISELFENEGEMILEDIDDVCSIEEKYGVSIDDILDEMTPEQVTDFYAFINKKGTGKKGRYTKADTEKYKKLYVNISNTVMKIKEDLNK